MWRLPLHDEYKEGLKSDVADLNNISSQRGAGAIVAGLFMRDFTGGVPVGAPRHRGHGVHRARAAARAQGRDRASASARCWRTSRRSAASGRPSDGRRRSTSTRTPRRPTAASRRASSWPEAARRGVRVLAVTDHDSTEGLAEAMARPRADAARSRSSRASRSTATSRAPRSTSSATCMDYAGAVVPGVLPRAAARAARARPPDGRAAGRSSACRIDADEVFAIVKEGSAGRPHVAQVMVDARLRQDGARGLRQVPGARASPATCRGRSSRPRTRCGSSARRAACRSSRTRARRPRRDDPGLDRGRPHGHRVLLHRALGRPARRYLADLPGSRPGRDGRLRFPRPRGAGRQPGLARRADVSSRRAPRQSRASPRAAAVLVLAIAIAVTGGAGRCRHSWRRAASSFATTLVNRSPASCGHSAKGPTSLAAQPCRPRRHPPDHWNPRSWGVPGCRHA